MFGIGPMELVLILVVALLVLGPKRMPELARTLGRGLSEFRRASNDLRQSLALDDLQNDLREGLKGAGTIHKPGQQPEDRPAQAGDDLAPGADKKPDSSGESTANAAAEGSRDAEESDVGERLPPGGARSHPGEPPLDTDPHAHNEGEGARDDSASTNASDTSNISGTSDTDTKDGQSRASTARPADSDLGNVPVGGATPGKTPVTDNERG